VNTTTQVDAINPLQFNEGVLAKKMEKQLRENMTILKDLLEVQRILPPFEKNLN